MKKLIKKSIKHSKKIIPKLKSRKLWFATVLGLAPIFALFAGVWFFSQQQWDNYSTNNDRLYDKFRTDIESPILGLSSAAVDRKAGIKAISLLETKSANEMKTYCSISPLLQWQSFIDQYSKKISSCNQKKERIQNLISSIGKVSAYIVTEDLMADVITTANLETVKINQSDKWSEVEALWRKASLDVSKLANVPEFNDTKAGAIKVIDGIADAWKTLSSANDAKNRQQFESARDGLGGAYQALGDVNGASSARLDKIILELNNYLL